MSSKIKVEEDCAPVKPGGVPTQAAFDQIFLNKKKWVSSILSSPHLNTSKWKHLLTQLTSHQFDTIFLEIYHLIDPTIALKFFYFASTSAGFKFILRSYCLLIHLLVSKNLDCAARLLLIRLIDKKLPVILNDNIVGNMHKEITVLLANLYSGSKKFDASIRTLDILVHVYASQFKSLGFDVAVDVFRLLASRGLFPSFKTSNFLLSSLIKADELEKCYEVFNIISSAILPDVYLFSTAINALCKGGRVNDAVMLFKKMEGVGITPNVVTYNNLLHGLCKKGNLEEAFQLKEKMVNNGVNPSLVTYGVLINGLMKLKKYDEANLILKEMLVKGHVPNEIVFNTLIDGYCRIGNVTTALKLKDDMLSQGISPNSVTFNTLLNGLCMDNQIDLAEQFLVEMVLKGLSINPGTFGSVIHGLCKNSRLDSALHFTRLMVSRNLRPNDRLLTTLIHRLCKNSKHSEALKLWYMLLDLGIAANTVTSNALIFGLCEVGNIQEAKILLKNMLKRGVGLDVVTYNALIYGCCKEGKLESGFNLKEDMVKQGISPDIVTYTLLMHGLCSKCKLDEAVALWHECQRNGLIPNVHLYGVMIDEDDVGNDNDYNVPSDGINELSKIGSEVGSPVDMAKSYMKVRPPWASPTKQIEVRTPSTMMMEPFKEGTRDSVGSDSLSLLKKRNSLASGSWNIQEELRRVHSKATDDMLRSLSSRIDLSLATKNSLGYLGTDIPAAGMLE
ncbi:pentatricopeptide repeat-containing At4g19440, chloroplastic [Olea europaea subsp. europaea]|uniref:Pentatricopeptide repeat-containing At4g19440, chloroplastic n=1 Tax=Olea europaea subsp. europaea TaxID=158383 RepID=A0A8S0VNC5_OLEEU|nr:pentatricopeptide repeat-containing At4g19440, chloroplastic [Olea europaea subsp. europaea]